MSHITITNAVYQKSMQGIATNMFSRALPAFITDAEIAQMENIPAVPSLAKTASSEKMAFISPVMDHAFILSPEFLPLMHTLDQMVHRAAEAPSTGHILLVWGQPGSGRKTAVRKAVSRYPQIILHSQYESAHCPCIQLPILWVPAGINHTVSGFREQLAGAVRAALKPVSDHFRLCSTNGFSPEDLLTIVHTSLVVEDLRFIGKTASQIHAMTDYLISLTRIGVSLLLIADAEQKTLISVDLRDAMDLRSETPIELKPLSEGRYYDHFLRKLWKCLIIPGPEPGTEIAQKLLNRCYGNIALIVRSLKEVQIRALTLSKESFTTEDLDIAIANCTSELSVLSQEG